MLWPSIDARTLFQERPLVEPVAPHDVTKAGRVGQRDRDDSIAGPRGARELVALGRHHLDVERQTPEVREDEPAERGPPGLEEILMDRIGQEEIGRPGHVPELARLIPAAIARAERVGPRPEARPPSQRARSLERVDLKQARRALHQIGVGEQQERREGGGLGEGSRARASVKADRASALGEIEGDEPGARVPSEEKWGVLDGEHALGRELLDGDAIDGEIGEADVRSPRRHGVRILASPGSLNP